MSLSRDRWLGIVYAAAIFTSAFLLFQIQPLISKRLLPWFGGTPAVWTTCLLFFQTVLFAGYAYAHWSNSQLTPRRQVLTHGALILIALAFLRALPSEDWEPAGGEDPVPRILLILAASIGLPYFVLSATGPLLQAWFARAFPGRTPYRLYALSNIGSLRGARELDRGGHPPDRGRCLCRTLGCHPGRGNSRAIQERQADLR